MYILRQGPFSTGTAAPSPNIVPFLESKVPLNLEIAGLKKGMKGDETGSYESNDLHVSVYGPSFVHLLGLGQTYLGNPTTTNSVATTVQIWKSTRHRFDDSRKTRFFTSVQGYIVPTKPKYNILETDKRRALSILVFSRANLPYFIFLLQQS